MTSTVPTTAAHQPVWADQDAVPSVLAELRARHPLVRATECDTLRGELAEVAMGGRLVLQGGDCAEPFADARGGRVLAKAAQLAELAALLAAETGAPVTRIGRFAGQYAKPRSQPTETLPDGRVVPAFLGEAVNGPEPDPVARRTDVTRLLAAYDHSARALDELFGNRLPAVGDDLVYVSHEGLLLEYERALVRGDHASSAHLLWIGERTRFPGSAHLAFAESIANPVGVKLGPTATVEETVAMVDQLGTVPGRLTFIVRMGAATVGERLPVLLDGLGPRARRVVWLTDPMHANTRRTATGKKTRVLDDILTEVRAFFAVLGERGLHPGGLHLELTPDQVTECVDHAADLGDPCPLPRFESLCDPRLNHEQSVAVVATAARLAARYGSWR
ncbi:3-deoxy-7-phosphoheptulonate synthase [Actinophytocola sediminis]